IGLEQSGNSIKLNDYQPPTKCALLLGAEVDGIPHDLLNQCDDIVEIAMYGQKESFNVAQATAIALFVLREA
ncbi:TrmH family RNA methyltransferase, partial [Candidatus Saccharibacteria bacterium]|nr:TrmH family RNA methyltransferase [Candidatus Saccharibacteria bacterium]